MHFSTLTVTSAFTHVHHLTPSRDKWTQPLLCNSTHQHHHNHIKDYNLFVYILKFVAFHALHSSVVSITIYHDKANFVVKSGKLQYREFLDSMDVENQQNHPSVWIWIQTPICWSPVNSLMTISRMFSFPSEASFFLATWRTASAVCGNKIHNANQNWFSHEGDPR